MPTENEVAEVGEVEESGSTEELESSEASQEETEEPAEEAPEGSEEGSENSEEGEESEDSEEGESNEEESSEEEDPSKQIYKVQTDGQEFEVSLEDLVTNYQLKKASYDRFQEASNKEKQVMQVVDLMKTDPLSAMKAVGLKGDGLKQFFYETAKAMLEEDGMSDEEKEAKAIREENQRLKGEKEARDKEALTQKESNAQREAQENYQKEFSEVLKSSGLSVTPQAVQRMATLMHNSLSNGHNMSVKEAAAYYKEEQTSAIKAQIGGLSGDQLVSLLGKETADKLRKSDIAKIKNPVPKNPPKLTSDKKKKEPPKSMSEFLDT